MSNLTGKFIIGGIVAAAATLFAGSALAAAPSQAAAKTKAAKAAAKAPAGTVMIGDFAGVTRKEQERDPKYGAYVLNRNQDFGWGWATSTDQVMGGHSTADIALIHPGAAQTKTALRITGEIKPGFPEPWAGAIWFPGHLPMRPANLAGKKELVFQARGKPGDYRILMLSGGGFIPESVSFTVTAKWKEYHIPLAKSFPDADWKRVAYLVFTGTRQGKFELDLDQVSLH